MSRIAAMKADLAARAGALKHLPYIQRRYFVLSGKGEPLRLLVSDGEGGEASVFFPDDDLVLVRLMDHEKESGTVDWSSISVKRVRELAVQEATAEEATTFAWMCGDETGFATFPENISDIEDYFLEEIGLGNPEFAEYAKERELFDRRTANALARRFTAAVGDSVPGPNDIASMSRSKSPAKVRKGLRLARKGDVDVHDEVIAAYWRFIPTFDHHVDLIGEIFELTMTVPNEKYFGILMDGAARSENHYFSITYAYALAYYRLLYGRSTVKEMVMEIGCGLSLPDNAIFLCLVRWSRENPAEVKGVWDLALERAEEARVIPDHLKSYIDEIKNILAGRTGKAGRGGRGRV